MNHNTVRLAMLVVLGVAGHARHIEAAVVLVSSYRWNHVKEYDFETGQYLRTLVPSSGGGLSQAGEIALGPGQDVYVSSLGNNRICHYDESSGAFLGAIGVDRYDGGTGQFLDHFIDAQPHGSYWSSGIAIYEPVPEPSTLALLGIGVLGLLGWAWRREPRLSGSTCAIVCLVAVLACTALAADQAFAGPTIVTTGISSIMVPPAIDWHERILNVHIRNGVPNLVTCSGGSVLDTFQPGQDLFDWKLSQYGVAYVQRPQVLYVRPAGGQSQYVYSAITSLGCLSMNDSGTVCYASRDTTHHGLREMWIRQPDQSPVQLPAPASGEVTVDKMAVSSTGNV